MILRAYIGKDGATRVYRDGHSTFSEIYKDVVAPSRYAIVENESVFVVYDLWEAWSVIGSDIMLPDLKSIKCYQNLDIAIAATVLTSNFNLIKSTERALVKGTSHVG